MHLSDINNEFAIDVEFIRGNPNWKKFVEELKTKCEKIKEPSEIYKFFEANKYTLAALKEHNSSLWNNTIPGLWQKAYKKLITEAYWSQPKSDADVQYVIGLLKNGLLVEDAEYKLYDCMGYAELYEQIDTQKQYIPKSNFADTLANFIVKLEPKNNGIKKMQDAILHDPELAQLVVSPLEIKETTTDAKSNINSMTKHLHSDLEKLKQIDKLVTETALAKLYIRANQIQEHPDTLKNQYVRNYKKDSLMWFNALSEAAIQLAHAMARHKKAGKLDKIVETVLLMKYANKHNVDSDELQLKLVEMYSSKKKTLKKQKVKKSVKEKAHKVTLDRLYAAGNAVLKANEAKVFGRRKPDEKPVNAKPCFNCDGRGHIRDHLNMTCPTCHGKGHTSESIEWHAEAKWLHEAVKNLIERVNGGEDWFTVANEQATQFASDNKSAYDWAFENLVYRSWQNDLLSEDESAHINWYGYINKQLKEHGAENLDKLAKQYAETKENYDESLQFARIILKQLSEDVVPFPIDKARIVAPDKKKRDAINGKSDVVNFPAKKKEPEETKSSRLSARLQDYANLIKDDIDFTTEQGNIKTWHDASNLLVKIREEINAAFEGYDLEQVRDYIWHIFHENTEEGIYHYIEKKARESGHFKDNADVEEAFGRKKPEAEYKIVKQPEIKDEPSNECPNCDGTGTIQDRDYTQCKSCRGTGKVVKEDVIPFKTHKKHTYNQAIEKQNNHTHRADTGIEPCEYCGEINCDFDCDQSQMGDELGEDVVDFPIDKARAAHGQMMDKGADVVDFPERKERLLHMLADWAHDKIMKNYIGGQREAQDVKDMIVNKVKEHNINIKEFDEHFRTLFSIGLNNMITLKRLEDENSSSGYHRFESTLEEGINYHSAAKARNGLYRMLRKMTDTSNIAMLSNFESYEGNDKISLKMNVYENNPKKLEKILLKLKEYFEKDGWMRSQKDGDNRFIKGDEKDGVMIKIHPIRKTYRTGAYKNREVQTMGIEIIGSKRVPINNNGN